VGASAIYLQWLGSDTYIKEEKIPYMKALVIAVFLKG